MGITLDPSPRAYGLPSDHWRPHQNEIVQEILSAPTSDTVIIEAPVGYGKSYLPGVISYFHPQTTVCVGTRDLQSQYPDIQSPDVEDWVEIIWGQSHYDCEDMERIAEFQSLYGEDPSRADCTYKNVRECEYHPCDYERTKYAAMRARLKVLNYYYAFYSQWWRECTSVLFCDEAHRLPTTLSDLVSVEMKDVTRERFGLPPFPLAVGGSPYAVKRALQWAESASMALLPYTKAKDIKVKRRAERMRENLDGFATSLSKATEAEWYIQSKPGEKFFARPVIPGPYAAALTLPPRLYPSIGPRVLMSATIGGIEGAGVLARELDIGNYSFRSYPHIFALENRRVFLIDGAPRMSYKSPDSHYKDQFSIIRKILSKHPGQRGIIHCMSWRHAEMIKSAIQHNGRRIMVPRGERVKSIQGFLDSEEGTVVISPSWHEGLDFRDDRARFAIIAKVNYLSLGDPVVALRLKRKGGHRWYQHQACLGVVQSCGRIVRHEQDYGTSYIVDSNWTRCQRYSPSWFEWERLTL